MDSLVNCEYTYWIKRYDDESIKISREEFVALKPLLNKTEIKFIELRDGRVINKGSIKEVVPVSMSANSDFFAETGINPYYREWCGLTHSSKKTFEEWVTNVLKKEGKI